MIRVHLDWTGMAVLLAAPPVPAPDGYDLLIRVGRVVDGTGNPWFVADLGIVGDTIGALGSHCRAAPGA